jgi:hypothetical protein
MSDFIRKLWEFVTWTPRQVGVDSRRNALGGIVAGPATAVLSGEKAVPDTSLDDNLKRILAVLDILRKGRANIDDLTKQNLVFESYEVSNSPRRDAAWIRENIAEPKKRLDSWIPMYKRMHAELTKLLPNLGDHSLDLGTLNTGSIFNSGGKILSQDGTVVTHLTKDLLQYFPSPDAFDHLPAQLPQIMAEQSQTFNQYWDIWNSIEKERTVNGLSFYQTQEIFDKTVGVCRSEIATCANQEERFNLLNTQKVKAQELVKDEIAQSG